MASQAVYVDLDLKGNAVKAIATPIDGTDATHKDYVDTADGLLQDAIDAIAGGGGSLDTKADKSTTVTAGPGLNGGGTLAADFALGILTPTDSGLSINDTGIFVDVGSGLSRTPAEGVSVNVDNVSVKIVGDALAVDQTWLDGQIAAQSSNIEAGDGIGVSLGTGTGGADVISVDASVVRADGSVAFTAVQTGVPGVAATDLATWGQVQAADTILQTNIDNEAAARIAADGVLQAAIDQEVLDRTAGDDALGLRIDGISIVGTGVAVATETGDNQWTVDVPAIQLANTYTGPGTDSASINADLSGRSITPQAGDLYINDTAGTSFLNTGLAAPGDWVELAAAEVGVDSITGGDASITVTNGAGPVADVALSAALQSAISVSTASNVAQDMRLAALEADTHVPVTSATGAITVVGQAVGLLIDPLSPELTQSTAGLKVDLTGGIVGATPHAAAVGTAGEVSVTAAQVVSLDPAFTGRVANLEAASHAAAVSGGAEVTVDGTTQAVALSTAFLNRVTAIETKNTQQDTAISNETGRALAAEGALYSKIDGINVVGTGAATVTEGPTDTFTVNVVPTAPGDITLTGDIVGPANATAIAAGVIVDADVSATANIAPTKIAGLIPAFQAAGAALAAEVGLRTTGDTNLQAAINAIQVLGTGTAVVTEGPADTWTVNVPATTAGTITLAGDVTGPGDANTLAAGVVADVEVAAAAGINQTKIASSTGKADLAADIAGLNTAITDEVTRATGAETTLDTKINALSITGTGMATVTETALDSGVWTVDVPAIQLANTYTGPGTDSASINADLAGRVPPITPQAGDLYINATTGTAFLNSGLAAPGDWVELSSASVGVDSITGSDGSITVTSGAGPVADVALSAALQTAISDSTAANAAQDGLIATLQTDLAAEVTARTDGDAALQAAIDALNLSQAAQDTAIADLETNDALQDADIDALQASQATQDAAIAALEAKHPAPATLVFTGDDITGYTATVTGPADGVAVVKVDGCLATFTVCETAGSYTVSSNVAVTGVATLHFG